MFVCLNLNMCIKCVAGISSCLFFLMRFCIRNVRISSTLSGCASQVRPILGAAQIWKISPPKKIPSMDFPGLKNLNSKMLMVGKGEECHSVTPFCMEHTMVHVIFHWRPCRSRTSFDWTCWSDGGATLLSAGATAPLSTSSLGPRLCCLGMDWRWLNDSWSKRKMQKFFLCDAFFVLDTILGVLLFNNRSTFVQSCINHLKCLTVFNLRKSKRHLWRTLQTVSSFR